MKLAYPRRAAGACTILLISGRDRRGRRTKPPGETAAEMAEIVEPAGKAGFGHAQALFQHAFGAVQSNVAQVGVRRLSREFCEDAREIEQAHADRTRQRRNRMRL